MEQMVELHVVIGRHGVSSVQIIGPPESHHEGHDLYFRIRDLVQEFNKAILERIENDKEVIDIEPIQ